MGESLCVLLAAVAAAIPSQAVDVWLTRGNQTSLLEQRPALHFEAGPGSHTTRIQIDPSTTFQSIEGFGAAMTDSSAWLIEYELNAAQRNALMERLFSTETGIGMSFVRIPIGASDFALSAYTYDDVPPGQIDPNLDRFSIAHDQAYIIPVLQQAASLNPGLKFMATPWTPPAWMKTTQSLFGGSLDTAFHGAYAQYFVRFIQAYTAEGLAIHALSVQNEPLHNNDTIPSATMTTTQQSAFIGDHLGPALAAAGIETSILTYDHNWDEWRYPVAVLNDPEANPYIAGSAFHAYGGDVSSQTTVHDLFPDKDIYFTEVSGGGWATDFADNLVWNLRHIIIGATRNWARTALIWNIALDENSGPHLPGGCGNCRGVVTIDTASGDVAYEVEYYVLGHASKFVQPSARRIASDSIYGELETVAFRNPGGAEVVIALNPDNSPRSFDVVRGGKFFSYDLPGKSVATFVWQAVTPGDLNCDGRVDGADIGPFVEAVLNPSQYQVDYPECDMTSGDLNIDGRIAFIDVELFVPLLLAQ